MAAQWQQLFQQDVHFSKLAPVSEESLIRAAIPPAVLTEVTSHTVFVWKKPSIEMGSRPDRQ